jgi:membrane protease YdiL (CAAX protease family)
LSNIILVVWPFFANDLYMIFLGNDTPVLYWTLDVIFFLTIPTVTLICLVKRNRLTLEDLGIATRPGFGEMAFGLALCVALLIVREPLLPWLKQVLPWSLSHGYGFPVSEPFHTGLIIYAALTAGILEEIIFRGMVTSELLKRINNPVVVAIISLVIFAAIHWSQGPFKLTWTFIWGVVPTIWFLKTRSVWGLIVCHVLYDLVVFLRFG